MAKMNEFYFQSSDGKNTIHAIEWLPENGEVKAVVQLSHGIAEYVGRYDAFARFLADRGFAVVGNDHLGHGESVETEEDLGFFAEENGWELVVSDIHKLKQLEKGKYPNAPYFLFGHSMGSFLARTYLIDRPGELDGCIICGTGNQPAALCSVGISVARSIGKKSGIRTRSNTLNNICFGSYNKRIKPRRSDYDWLTRDDAIVDAYLADPRCGYVATVSLLEDMLGGIKYIVNKKNQAKMDKATPIFFIAGAEDPVGDYGKGVRAAFNAFIKAGVADCSVKLYPGGRHEILNETNRGEVFEDVFRWLGSRI